MQAAAKLFPVPTGPQSSRPWFFSNMVSNFWAYLRHRVRFFPLYFVCWKFSKVEAAKWASMRLALLSFRIFSISCSACSAAFLFRSSSFSHSHSVVTFILLVWFGSSGVGSATSMNLWRCALHTPQTRKPSSFMKSPGLRSWFAMAFRAILSMMSAGSKPFIILPPQTRQTDFPLPTFSLPPASSPVAETE